MSLFDLVFSAAKEDKDDKKRTGEDSKRLGRDQKKLRAKMREFLKKWLDEFDWLRYDDKLCSMFVLL